MTGRSPFVTMLDTGGRVVLRERFSRTRFWPDVLDHGVTHASLAAAAGMLADEPGPGHDRHPLRIVLGGWYRTGDAVWLREDGGGVQFVDPMRDTIRRFGENISSSAVEHAVLKMDAVAERAVVGVLSKVAGHEVMLVLVPSGDALIDAARLVARLRDLLPHHAVPRYVRVVDDLPKTANGKIRKTALPALA